MTDGTLELMEKARQIKSIIFRDIKEGNYNVTLESYALTDYINLPNSDYVVEVSNPSRDDYEYNNILWRELEVTHVLLGVSIHSEYSGLSHYFILPSFQVLVIQECYKNMIGRIFLLNHFHELDPRFLLKFVDDCDS